jgi:hypothetical protein
MKMLTAAPTLVISLLLATGTVPLTGTRTLEAYIVIGRLPVPVIPYQDRRSLVESWPEPSRVLHLLALI